MSFRSSVLWLAMPYPLAGQLLRDGARALVDAADLGSRDRGANDPHVIDAVVLPKPAVLLGDECIDEVQRDRVVFDGPAVLHHVKASDFLAVAVINQAALFEERERREIERQRLLLIMRLDRNGRDTHGQHSHASANEYPFHPPFREDRCPAAAAVRAERGGRGFDEVSNHKSIRRKYHRHTDRGSRYYQADLRSWQSRRMRLRLAVFWRIRSAATGHFPSRSS